MLYSNPIQIEKDINIDNDIASNRDEGHCIKNDPNTIVNKLNMFCSSGRITVVKGKSTDNSDVNSKTNNNRGNINSSNINNSNNHLSKGFGYYVKKYNQKRISYTAMNSRKNSNEKKISKLISNVSNKQLQPNQLISNHNNAKKNTNGSSKSKEKQCHIKSNINLNFSNSKSKSKSNSNSKLINIVIIMSNRIN